MVSMVVSFAIFAVGALFGNLLPRPGRANHSVPNSPRKEINLKIFLLTTEDSCPKTTAGVICGPDVANKERSSLAACSFEDAKVFLPTRIISQSDPSCVCGLPVVDLSCNEGKLAFVHTRSVETSSSKNFIVMKMLSPWMIGNDVLLPSDGSSGKRAEMIVISGVDRVKRMTASANLLRYVCDDKSLGIAAPIPSVFFGSASVVEAPKPQLLLTHDSSVTNVAGNDGVTTEALERQKDIKEALQLDWNEEEKTKTNGSAADE